MFIKRSEPMNASTLKSTLLAGAAGIALMSALPMTSADAAGLMSPTGSGLPKLELRDHNVKVIIEDGYAITTIEQRFANPNGQDLEAVYSFPVPEKAAVSEFTYWIDGKPVTGEIVEKDRARKIYAEEKQAGREVGVTEQDDYKSFDMRVWPVRANGDVQVRLSYIQPARLDTGIGRFVYPLEEGGVDEQKLSFWTATDEVTGNFSFDLHLKTDYPIDALRLPAHPSAVITRQQDGTWRAHIDNSSPAAPATADTQQQSAQPLAPAGQEEETATSPAGNTVRLDTDIAVYWRQSSGQPARVDLVPYKIDPSGRGTFALTLTPGMDLQPITEGRDWVFVLDQSGSMGSKIATLAEGVTRALGKLRPEDRFRIILFNNKAQELTNGFVPVNAETVHRYSGLIQSVQATGGTNLYAGLSLGMNALDADRTGAIVLVTDGVANVGVTENRKFFDLAKQKDIRLFTAIMGNSANRPLLEPLTRLTNGTALSVSNSDDVVGVLLNATTKVTHEALHGMTLDIRSTDGNVKINDIARDDIRTLYNGEQLVLFGHYWNAGAAEVTLSGKISGKPVSYTTKFDFPATADRNPEVERLWAYQTIETELHKMSLLGEDPDARQSVIDISKEFGIVSPFTSMITMREERFAELGIARTNKKRLEVEQTAQAQRASQPVKQTRVDTSQPMFSNPQPTYSNGSRGGSGNLGIIGVLLAACAAFFGLRART
jgi:Ca-activated chloride channel family protein